MPIIKRPAKEALLQMYSKDGLTDREVARRLGVNTSTVFRWRKHYGIEISIKHCVQVRTKKEAV